MNTSILCALTAAQVEALIAWHHHEAQHAGLVQVKSDHLRDAADLRRRLIEAAERTEVAA